MASAEARPASRRSLLEQPGFSIWTIVLTATGAHVLWLLDRGISYPLIALIYAGFLSLVTFLVFGLDKWRSGRSGRRVSELNLLLLALAGGALGGLVAMGLLHHKGRHLRFRLVLPVALFVHVAGLTLLAVT